jgi:hypothetical protein
LVDRDLAPSCRPSLSSFQATVPTHCAPTVPFPISSSCACRCGSAAERGKRYTRRYCWNSPTTTQPLADCLFAKECARVPRVGFAMVSLKELVMAELNPWRMKDITTIPINGRTISKNRRSVRLLSPTLPCG